MTSPIDSYIDGFDGRHRELLVELRDLVRSLVPDAGEKISYGMPTFTLGGRILVHFGAQPRHIGFYPTPEGVLFAEPFLGGLKHSKGAIQFPLDADLPVDLVRRVVGHRVEQVRGEEERGTVAEEERDAG